MARLIFNVCFWMINFVINIPLFIFASIKINRNFAILTMLFMLFATIFGIAFSSIPGSENWLILGKVIDSNFTKNAINQPNSIVQNNLQLKLWSEQCYLA
ncbi:YitT family protein, partial [Mycoplasmopsis bovis]|uniref:YitT family protein n=1 Tax=Mycoplasmopsis bovis TaxID=28903 RepID=UPI003D27EA14